MFRVNKSIATQTWQTLLSKLPSPPQLPPRLRGGMIENMINYLRNVYLDYQAVFLETQQNIRDRPLRSTMIGSVFGALLYAARHTPNQEDFFEQLVESNNKLSRVPLALQNKRSSQCVAALFQLHNQQVLRCQSLGIFSVIYREDYPTQTKLYAGQCKYLQPSWRSYLTERIVDIGFLDRYHWLHRNMVDYDVNNDEWQSNGNSNSNTPTTPPSPSVQSN